MENRSVFVQDSRRASETSVKKPQGDAKKPHGGIFRFYFYTIFIRPILFLLDAEQAHTLVFSFARWAWRFPLGRWLTRVLFGYSKPVAEREAMGLHFKNPIGLAAGFDKNATLLPGIEALGFGFVEIGTVTPRPQLGNQKPRLFRLPDKRAVLNRMGFNNDGADVILRTLRKKKDKITVPLGVNIGKNRDTPNTDALRDYETLLKMFSGVADYFVINISSPNTPGLRDLQQESFIQDLSALVLRLRVRAPVLVKLSPDISEETLRMVCSFCGPGKGLGGLVLTNTLPTDLGGISGAPLKGPSLQILQLARRFLSSEIPIISVGGIESADDVAQRLQAGATLVQMYTHLVYEGPGAVRFMLKSLDLLQKAAV